MESRLTQTQIKQLQTHPLYMRPNKEKGCVPGNGSGNYRNGRPTFFYLQNDTISCILKGILPFKMHKIIFSPRKPEKKI